MEKRNTDRLRAFTLIIILSVYAGSAAATKHMRFNIKKNKKQTHNIFNYNELSSKYASWGISPLNLRSSIDLKAAWKKVSKPKRDVIVAIIDTGIDHKHPFLKDNIYKLGNFINSYKYGVDFSKNRKHKFRPKDNHGHGTHVAGIVKSVYPKVKLLILKYFSPQATGRDNLVSTVDALRYAVNSGVDVINYSGGGPEPHIDELKILKKAEKKGILIVAAAGNEEENIDIKTNAYYPASYGLSNIITVSAYDRNLKILPSANYGKHSVDIFAPGYRIKSALPKNRAGYLTGTSQATAFVSGVAALIKSQYPRATATQIKDIISNSADLELGFRNKCKTGGRLNAHKALLYAKGVFEDNITPIRNVATRKKQKTGKILYRKAK